MAFFRILVLVACACLSIASQARASDFGESIGRARRSVAEKRPEFALMEYGRALREAPAGSPESREASFAIAEYHFDQGAMDSAGRGFKKVPAGDGTTDLLSAAFLERIAVRSGDRAAAADATRRLKEALSSRKFFSAFGKERKWNWRSPMGARFELRESVDRLEILRDGSTFVTVRLP